MKNQLNDQLEANKAYQSNKKENSQFLNGSNAVGRRGSDPNQTPTHRHAVDHIDVSFDR